MKFLIVVLLAILANEAAAVEDLDLKWESLRAHNIYRRRHGVRRMKWDINAASFAQSWCDKLKNEGKFEHSKGSGFGENLFWASGDSSSVDAGKSAVKSWYDEIKDYDYKNPGFAGKTGHFTQVMEYIFVIETRTINRHFMSDVVLLHRKTNYKISDKTTFSLGGVEELD